MTLSFKINFSSSVNWLHPQQTASFQERTESELYLITESTDYKGILQTQTN
jgi:hypothetical protein